VLLTNLGILGNICGMKRRLITISIIAVLLVGCGVVYLTTLYRYPAAESKSGPVSIEEQERTIAMYQQQEAKADPPTEQSILNAVNTERAKVGVAPLKLHPNLSKTAQMKADDMITRNYRGHYMPDTNQPLTEEMRQLQDAACINASENLTWNDSGTDTKQSIDWWLSSPLHKDAMLDPKYTYTGIGIGDSKVVVQHFCVAR